MPGDQDKKRKKSKQRAVGRALEGQEAARDTFSVDSIRPRFPMDVRQDGSFSGPANIFLTDMEGEPEVVRDFEFMRGGDINIPPVGEFIAVPTEPVSRFSEREVLPDGAALEFLRIRRSLPNISETAAQDNTAIELAKKEALTRIANGVMSGGQQGAPAAPFTREQLARFGLSPVEIRELVRSGGSK